MPRYPQKQLLCVADTTQQTQLQGTFTSQGDHSEVTNKHGFWVYRAWVLPRTCMATTRYQRCCWMASGTRWTATRWMRPCSLPVRRGWQRRAAPWGGVCTRTASTTGTGAATRSCSISCPQVGPRICSAQHPAAQEQAAINSGGASLHVQICLALHRGAAVYWTGAVW